MLHSLQPGDFVRHRRFLCGHGVVSLTHYRVGDTKEVRRGLACFCSTTCLLRWEQPEMLGLMQ
jgi:hypothetical protein